MKYLIILESLKDVGIILSPKQKNETVRIMANRIIGHPSLIQDIVNCTQFLKFDATIKERIKCLLLDLDKQPTCMVCGGVLHMTKKLEFKKYCSSECVSRSDIVRQKYINTSLEKFGKPNYFSKN